MNEAVSPAALGNHVVESLLGDTGEPERVLAAARALGRRLNGAIMGEINAMMAYPVDMELKEADATRFAQAVPTEPSNCAICVAASGTSPDALTMIIDADAIALLLSVALGGDPEIAVMPIERDLTSIELALAGQVFNVVARCFEGSGERALGLELPLTEITTGSGISRMSTRDGPAARIEFRFHTPQASGTLTVLMPQRVLLNQRSDGAAAEDGPLVASKWRARFSEEVMRSAVTLEATVPLARATLGEIANWRVGQTIELPENAQAQTRLSARRKPVFVCEFGKLGNHFTVRVRHPFDAGKEFLDRLMKK
jgi:flagellar motor switch protein FliM